MSRKRLAAIFVVLLCLSTSLVQCSSYAACVRYYNAIYSKRGTCSIGSKVDYEKRAKDCGERLKECNDDDFVRVREATECIEKLEECKEQISWGLKLLQCQGQLTKVSQACKEAFAK